MKINIKRWVFGFVLFLCFFSCKSEWTWTYIPPEIPEEKPSPVVFSFTESEIELVAFLKGLIPSNVRETFDAKYIAWVKSWERYSHSSWYRDYARSEEYFDLLVYCKLRGKALYPLVIDKIIFEATRKEENLLQDYMYHGDNWDRDFTSVPGGFLNLSSLYAYFCKNILKYELINILIDIIDISSP